MRSADVAKMAGGDVEWDDQTHSAAGNFALDLLASFKSIVGILRSVQTVIVIALAIGSPCFFYFYRNPMGDDLAADMNWSLISIAVLFPLTMSINTAFGRRERAIHDLASLKGNLAATFLAHRDWNWGKECTDRHTKLPKSHVDDVRRELASLLGVITRLLQAPIVSKARHLYTAKGRTEFTAVRRQTETLDVRIGQHFGRLSELVEEMKKAGLPGNEASRIRAYFSKAISSFEHLRSIKAYRTPLGVRTFARVYILLTPVVMGPYYAYLAGADEDDGVGLPFACFFSLLASMAMQGLFSIRMHMEDPFTTNVRSAPDTDTIDLREQFAAFYVLLDSSLSDGLGAPDERVPPTASLGTVPDNAAPAAADANMLKTDDGDGTLMHLTTV